MPQLLRKIADEETASIIGQLIFCVCTKQIVIIMNIIMLLKPHVLKGGCNIVSVFLTFRGLWKKAQNY